MVKFMWKRWWLVRSGSRWRIWWGGACSEGGGAAGETAAGGRRTASAAEIAGGRGRRVEVLQECARRERSTSSKRGREGDVDRNSQKMRKLNEVCREVQQGMEQCQALPAEPRSALSQDLNQLRKG